MSFLVTRSNVPHRPIKTKSARFSTGRDKQCKGRTKHGRKERIHSCHHWVGRTGQRTIGWRRLSERWNWNESAQLTTQDSGIQNATKAQRIVEFSAAHRARNTLAARIWFPFFPRKIDTFFSLFFIFYIFSSKKNQKKKIKQKLTSRNIFSIENQMQVIPLARNPREKKQKETKNTCHRFAICTQSPLCNSCLENCSQESCLWFMSFSHVYGSCWTVWSGFAIFP